MNFIENESKLVTLNNLITQSAPNYDLYLWSACEDEFCTSDNQDFYTVNGYPFDPTEWTEHNYAEYCFNTVGTFWIVCQAKNINSDDSCFYKFKAIVEESSTIVEYIVTPNVCGIPADNETYGNLSISLTANHDVPKVRVKIKNPRYGSLSIDTQTWYNSVIADVVNNEISVYIKFDDNRVRTDTTIDIEITSLNDDEIELVGTTETYKLRYIQPIRRTDVFNVYFPPNSNQIGDLNTLEYEVVFKMYNLNAYKFQLCLLILFHHH